MRALNGALEVRDALNWFKMEIAVIQKVVAPFSTEKPALSHK
jgi:hypothetical protein